MRKTFVVILMLFATAAFAAAQETPKVDNFAGYSLFHFDDNSLEDAATNACGANCFSFTKIMHGWETGVQFNINRTIGIVADFSGHYGTPITVIAPATSVDARMYNFLFGPQINVRGHRASGYIHTLFGVNHARVEAIPLTTIPEFSENGFAWAVGGGFDFNPTKTIGIRVGQLDYILTTHDFGLVTSSGHQNNLRFSAGLVFHVGQK